MRYLMLSMLFLGLAAAADAPAVPEHAKVKILKAQLEQSKLQSEANALQSRMAQIQQEWVKAQGDLDSAREEKAWIKRSGFWISGNLNLWPCQSRRRKNLSSASTGAAPLG